MQKMSQLRNKKKKEKIEKKTELCSSFSLECFRRLSEPIRKLRICLTKMLLALLTNLI